MAEPLEAWLAANRRPTAFLTVRDVVTMGVLAHLAQAGLLVRRDGSLVGYDYYPWMEAASLAMTAIRQDVAALAFEAGTLLRMKGGVALPRRMAVPCSLVLRDPVRRIGSAVPRRLRATRRTRKQDLFGAMPL